MVQTNHSIEKASKSIQENSVEPFSKVGISLEKEYKKIKTLCCYNEKVLIMNN